MTPDPEALRMLQDRVGYRFKQRTLLVSAITHPSAAAAVAAAAAADGAGYERLEFLGDRVLGLAVAELLFERFPAEDEGALSKRLVGLVRKEALLDVADAIGIGNVIELAQGTGGAFQRQTETAKADGVEALLGAIFVDGGYPPTRDVVRRWWTTLLDKHLAPPKDPKTTLQEWAQARNLPLPEYRMVNISGPDHQPTFEVIVDLEDKTSQQGEGRSKRAAEQAAATLMLEAIAVETP